MLRISEYLEASAQSRPIKKFPGAIAIWNLTRLCNLRCQHCYADAAPEHSAHWTLAEVERAVPQLREIGVKMIILSGGEPLLHPQIFEIAQLLRREKFVCYLSTNGWSITEKNLQQIKENFRYVGISVDGREEIHDRFRRREGSFRRAVRALRMCREAGIRAGLRFTLSRTTYSSLPEVFELLESLSLKKIYISHLVYAGRAGVEDRLSKRERLEAVEFILERALQYFREGRDIQIVTGNNESDAPLFWLKASAAHPELAEDLWARLQNWGGNRAGVTLLNITPEGEVRPDPFFPFSLGNMKREPLPAIWRGENSPRTKELLEKLRQNPRPVSGRCARCPFISICNGNSRVRALAETGDLFGPDPDCSLPDELLESGASLPDLNRREFIDKFYKNYRNSLEVN